MPSKYIILVRHAKSSWDDPSLSDRERPLNKRGKRDAPRMAKRLSKRQFRPQCILTSPALRASTTADVFARQLGLGDDNVEFNDDIYGASAKTLIDIIRKANDSFDCLMLVGHNPDLTLLANELAGTDIDNVPTCGVVALQVTCKKWSGVGKRTAKLVDFDFPKKAD